MDNVLALDIVGASVNSASAKYDILPRLHDECQSPVFKSRGKHPGRYMYHALDGRWHIGNAQKYKKKQPTIGLRSGTCSPRTLPCAIKTWEEPLYSYGCFVGFESSSVSMLGHSEGAIDSAWQELRADISDMTIEISGALAPEVNGRYDIQTHDNAGPPIFRRFGAPAGLELFLYYAVDGKWHIGSKTASERRCPGRRFRSSSCEVGTLPSCADGWEECAGGPYARSIRFEASDASVVSTPAARWSWQADGVGTSCAAIIIDGSNLACLNGRYELQPARFLGEAPAWKKNELDSEVWLFYCSDGRWRAGGDAEDRNEWRLVGPLRSCTCLPGVLPDMATWWEEDYGGFVRRDCIKVERRSNTWVESWSWATVGAVNISGAANDRVNGSFKVNGNHEAGEPPVFERQADVPGGHAMLLYYASDNRWHVGNRYDSGIRCFRYFKFDVTPRSGVAVHVGRIALSYAQHLLDMSTAVAINTDGHCKPGMGPQQVLACDLCSKWLDFKGKPLVIEFATPQFVDSFSFWTADDLPEQDPVQWKLSGSINGSSWTFLHLQTSNYSTPKARCMQTSWFALKAAEKRPSHTIRSKECQPGVMPHEVNGWEEFHRSPFGISAFRKAEIRVIPECDAADLLP